MYACKENSIEVVSLFLSKCPSIIEQRDKYGWTGFIFACYHNKIKIVKLMIDDKYPNIIDQESLYGKTGYDCLSFKNKKIIAEYITKNRLKLRKPILTKMK